MANANTDLTEEDAADLQFPKDDDLSTNTMLSSFSSNNSSYLEVSSDSNSYCANCEGDLSDKYILCEKCNVIICCTCFASGAEFGEHENNHDYRVLSHTFILFENSDWTAKEELTLLDAISNYGNWNLVAQELPNRSVSEIIDHYDYFYLQRNGSELMPKFKERPWAVFPQPTVPYRFRMADSDEPPRYAPNTVGYQSLAGYNAARSEFENEYDKNAEDILSNFEEVEEDDPDYELLTNMQCAIIRSYNRRLKKRQDWKDVMARHGLLVLRKTISWLHRYDLTVTKPVYEKLLKFMQHCEPVRFDMLMEGLHRAGELKLQIARLIELRKKGVTSLTEGRMYLKLRELHEDNQKALKVFRSNSKFSLREDKNSSFLLPKMSKRRSSFNPLDILGMPGYEKLSDKEKDLCRNIRLVPISYLELKLILVAENKKSGTVTLQTARKLLKIDVNKTRKLYDFLIEEGFILKP